MWWRRRHGRADVGLSGLLTLLRQRLGILFYASARSGDWGFTLRLQKGGCFGAVF